MVAVTVQYNNLNPFPPHPEIVTLGHLFPFNPFKFIH